MRTIQLVLRNSEYSERLRKELEQSGHCKAICGEIPDLKKDGVIVVDASTLDSLPWPLSNPERFVLVTTKDPTSLARAWERGIISVVYETDAVQTAVLAIMATCLRLHRAPSVSHQCVISPKAIHYVRAVPQNTTRRTRTTAGL
jgi:hypothetical protein